MSKIEELIREFCPEGVPSALVDELFAYEQPTKYLVASTDYTDAGTPVLTAGQTFLLGHTLESEGIYPASPSAPVIIFDDFTTGFQWVDFPFKAKSSAMKMITSRSGGKAELRFLFHWMGMLNFQPGEHARHWISVYSQFEIPSPPLEVQKEIVSILDKFTQLEAELEAELEARRTQYEVTRDRLLDLSSDLEAHPLREMIRELCPEGVQTFQLSDVAHVARGATITRNATSPGDVPVLAGGQKPAYWHNEPNRVGEQVVIAGSGAYAGFVSYWDRPVWVSDAFSIAGKPGTLLTKFCFYWLKNNQTLLHAMKRGSGVPHVYSKDVARLGIPLPPLEGQKEIVTILDNLDALVNDITFGLPAEIAARRKQYEYYRNRLLTFKELDAA